MVRVLEPLLQTADSPNKTPCFKQRFPHHGSSVVGGAVSESVIGDPPSMPCLTTLQQESVHCGPDGDTAACLLSRKVQPSCGKSGSFRQSS